MPLSLPAKLGGASLGTHPDRYGRIQPRLLQSARQGQACLTPEPTLSLNDRRSLATASWAEDRRLEGT